MSGNKNPDVPEHQEKQPAIQADMKPGPVEERTYQAAGKLRDKVALITGADSGIGRAVAILFAKEGAELSVVYLNEHQDAEETRRQVEEEKRRCLLIAGNVANEEFCSEAVRKTIDRYGRLDILVNNAGVQFPRKSLEEISPEQLENTFRTNIFSMFYLTRAALRHFGENAVIINTASVTAYQGNPTLIDYSSTKGAIVAFTRSLAISLASRSIRVNAVAPGPVWTPLVTSFEDEKLASFGENTPMGRAGQPVEIAPSYLFLASEDSSFMTGQVLHPNGGRIVNG